MLSATMSITRSLRSSRNAETAAVALDTVTHPLYQTLNMRVARNACPRELKQRQDGALVGQPGSSALGLGS